jgi:transposase-like protein
MPNSAIEIINGREGRRRWGVEEKLRIVAETHEHVATVGAVAARHMSIRACCALGGATCGTAIW